MKLSYRIVLRLSAVFLVVFTAWVIAFYYVIVDEINDETNDSLENYSEHIIRSILSGNPLPSPETDLNNTYFIREITPQEAMRFGSDIYYDEMVYVKARRELEPCRTMHTMFGDGGGKYYELKVSMPTIEKRDLLETLLEFIIYLYVLLLIVTISVTTWIISRSFRPLYRLMKWIDRFRVNEPVEELPIAKTDVTEFRKLNEAMLRTARHNVKVFEQQKEFISHASHELQTPLAISRNKLEMLLQDPSLNEQQLEQIYKAIQSINHIIQLNKTLLLYSKIENQQFPEVERINFRELLRNLTEEYEEIFAHRDVRIVWHNSEAMEVSMNPTLAKVLLSNLLKNAYLHNLEKGGEIHIDLTSEQCSMSNTGTSEALDGTLIFERFYHDMKQEHSSGLGLPIASSICELYGLRLSYRFEAGKHTFSISKKG
ncbi:HAMP domain-containing sensor histidine kinase [Porphyromonas gulae]|uniref:sensor histidine kinase n=1 Tax=Porphyromonas gulae TaxID=111105 RepID=UPI0026EAF6BB|nr:HAMP domain-containing sensor histidine kinase [Porphyromonas gulae]